MENEKMEEFTIDFSKWFNAKNQDHIIAVIYLEKNGFWEDGFIPDHVKLGENWQFDVYFAISREILDWYEK
jgi:hypothetical protein